MTAIKHHALPDGNRMAYRYHPHLDDAGPQSSAPLIVFLPGYMSDMAGSKATAILAMAQAQGRGCLLLDYTGCGSSDGDFADGMLRRWRDEVIALINAIAPPCAQLLLVGSSMGGWLMLLIALALPARIAGLVGIAAAPDFTRWGYAPAHLAALAAGEVILEDNPYGPEPTPTYPAFWRDGEANLMLDGAIALDCPVRLLHGQDDRDVPPEISLRLAAALRSQDVQITLVKGGDHRLSREGDLALLLATVFQFPG